MRSVRARIEPQFSNPAVQDSSVLASPEVARLVNTAWKQAVLRPKMRLRYPCPDRFTRRRGNFKLDRPLRFLLHDRRTSRDLIFVAYITYLQLEQVTATKLASMPRSNSASSRVR